MNLTQETTLLLVLLIIIVVPLLLWLLLHGILRYFGVSISYKKSLAFFGIIMLVGVLVKVLLDLFLPDLASSVGVFVAAYATTFLLLSKSCNLAWRKITKVFLTWWGIAALLTLLMIPFFQKYTGESYIVSGSAMEPTYTTGTYLFAQPQFEEISRGDVVVFQSPEDRNKHFILRIVGLPGESLEVREDAVYVNGEQLAEPYTTTQTQRTWSGTIPEGGYFLLGDNRDESSDSRVFGTVPEENIIGKVFR